MPLVRSSGIRRGPLLQASTPFISTLIHLCCPGLPAGTPTPRARPASIGADAGAWRNPKPSLPATCQPLEQQRYCSSGDSGRTCAWRCCARCTFLLHTQACAAAASAASCAGAWVLPQGGLRGGKQPGAGAGVWTGVLCVPRCRTPPSDRVWSHDQHFAACSLKQVSAGAVRAVHVHGRP